MMIRERINRLVHELSRGAYEREEVIALSLLSSVAGESIFLLGLPGVGKSMVARRLKSAFKDSTCFEYLMSRFSTPDEIFGPVSISKLKDNDTYERTVEGYLPTADVAFLDEIWKAGPAIQNSLLTALNEKIFHNGKYDINLTLKGIIAASNELPAEGEGLEALWDRFLIRYIVQPINNKDAFMKLIGGANEKYVIPETLALSEDEYRQMQSQTMNVNIPNYIMEAIYALRSLYATRFANYDEEDDNSEGSPYISDRRWKKMVGILRTSAYLNGRDEVDLSDCLLFEHMLWDKDDQLNRVREDVAEMVISSAVKKLRRRPEAVVEKTEELIKTEDGLSYIVLTGNDKLLISIEDYEKLGNGETVYGNIDSNNRIVLSSNTGHFKISCVKKGTLNINTFCYQLKKNVARVATSIESYSDNSVDLKDLISKNLFLRSGIESYPQLKLVANRYKGFCL